MYVWFRRCLRRMSSRIWIATSKARRSAGRSSLRAKRRRRKSFLRSGRTRTRCRNCAWCVLCDLTAWLTPSSKYCYLLSAASLRSPMRLRWNRIRYNVTYTYSSKENTQSIPKLKRSIIQVQYIANNTKNRIICANGLRRNVKCNNDSGVCCIN